MKPQSFTDEDAAAALTGCGGVVAEAAAKLGCSRSYLNRRIRASEELRSAKEEAREVLLDEAEFALFEAVRAGAPWAIRFMLARLGKDRGYSLNVNVTGQLEQSGRVVILLPDDGRNEPDENSPPRMTRTEFNATFRPSSN